MVPLLLLSQQSVHDATGTQQVANRSEQCWAVRGGVRFRRCCRAIQIGPGGRDQRSCSVRQLQREVIGTISMKMSKNAQRFSLHGMALAQDRYRGRKVADVGSVS